MDHDECLKELERQATRIAVLDGIVTRMAKRLRELGEDTAQFMPEPWSLDAARRRASTRLGCPRD